MEVRGMKIQSVFGGRSNRVKTAGWGGGDRLTFRQLWYIAGSVRGQNRESKTCCS